jgi:hypothetical protein
MLVLFHILSAFVDLLNDENCNSIPQNSMKVFKNADTDPYNFSICGFAGTVRYTDSNCQNNPWTEHNFVFFKNIVIIILETVIKCPNYIDVLTTIIIYQFASCLLLQFYVLA